MRFDENEPIDETCVTLPTYLHCVLVHGTFSRNAGWTHSASPLSIGLRSLNAGKICLHRFEWSGDNTHEARCDATSNLSCFLKDMAARFPEAKFLLIGHSHGGNIACAAASSLSPSQRAGVVTLATPFFHVDRRSLVPMASIPVLLWLTTSMIVIAHVGAWVSEVFARLNHWVYGWWAESLANHWLYQAYAIVIAVVSLLFFIALALWVASLALDSFQTDLRNRQNLHLSKWAPLHPSQTPTLCLSVKLDEALWGLRWLNWIPEHLHFLAEYILRYLAISLSLLALGFGIFRVLDYLEKSSIPILAQTAALQALTGIALAMSAATAAVFSVCLMNILATTVFLWLTYGLGSIFHHFFVKITIHRVPHIENREIVFRENLEIPLRQLFDDKLDLFHSRLCSDPRTIEKISLWLQLLADNNRAAPTLLASSDPP